MRRLLLVALLALPACSRAPEPEPAPAADQARPHIPNSAAPTKETGRVPGYSPGPEGVAAPDATPIPTGLWESDDWDSRARDHGPPWDNPSGSPSHNVDGPFVEFHEDGTTKKLEGEYKQTRQHGLWKAWWPNGTMRQKGTLEIGYQHGVWEAWYENGSRRGKGSYDMGKPDGIFFEWHPDDSLWQEYGWVKGKLQGEWYMLNPDGSMDEHGYYREGVPDGHWRLWHPNGQLAEELDWQLGKQTGWHVMWHEDGRLAGKGQWADGLPTGTWLCYPAGDDQPVEIEPQKRTHTMPAHECHRQGKGGIEPPPEEEEDEE
jgi:antitoxin component YwqK of YwqJK toxin-antitoxin module